MQPPKLPGATAPDPTRWFWFDGILEGRRGEDAALHAALAEVHAAGLVQLDLTVDGGRFTLLADNRARPGREWPEAAGETMLQGLARLVTLAAAGGRVESTLRCTEVGADTVRETLFAVRAGQLHPVSRQRPVTDDDLARAPDAPPPALVEPGSRRKALALGALLLLAFAGVAWQSGWVGAALAPRADALVVDAGPFRDLLQAQTGNSWGRYRIELRRGSGFPADKAQLEALLARAQSLADRAAVEAVGNGGTIWVRIERDDGHVLDARPVELRSLLGAAEARVEAFLPGRLAAARVHLALDAGLEGR